MILNLRARMILNLRDAHMILNPVAYAISRVHVKFI